jgi:hypothetical protein
MEGANLCFALTPVRGPTESQGARARSGYPAYFREQASHCCIPYDGKVGWISASLSSFRLRKISLVNGAEPENFRATSLHLSPGRRLGE